MKTAEQAVQWLEARCDPDGDPKVSPSEILEALESHRVSVDYASATAYTFGNRIQPGNGRMYKAARGGTSDATTVPTWPDPDTAKYGQRIYDGTVIWTDDGEEWGEAYDLTGAAKQVWELKVSRAAKFYNSSDRDSNLQEQQIYQHCLERASAYEPGWVA